MDNAVNTNTTKEHTMKIKLDYSITKLFPSGLWEISTILHGQLIRYRYTGTMTKREAINTFARACGLY